MKNIRDIIGIIVAILLLQSCYKEDNSTLYSRQYVMNSKLSDINDNIDAINKEISEIQKLYQTLINNTSIRSLEYLPDKEHPTSAKIIFGDGRTLVIPFGTKGDKGDTGAKGDNGKDGKDGKTPEITISSDGYWVINEVKTKHKVSGDTPIVRAKQDPDNTDDTNFYWTIQYGSNPPQFIMVNGQKIQANGTKGDKGDTGAKGDKGDTGAKGDKGDTGAKGDKGDTGAKGDKGDTGAKGDKGDTGAKGDKGDTGAKGDKGDTGAKGDKGDTGAKGDKGDTGAKGDKGDTGAKGDKGDTGAKGDKGDTGAKGDKGDTGPRGSEGTQPITNITQDGGKITLYTTFGDFTFDFSSLKFILKPQTIPTFETAKNTISYSDPTQSIDIPFEASPDVVSIGAILPTGWDYTYDIAAKKITLTAPSYENLSVALYDGSVSFIAFDQEQKSVNQFINIHLDTKIYLDYFYNPLATVPTYRSSNLSQNKIELETAGWHGAELNNILYYAVFDTSSQKLVETKIIKITDPAQLKKFPNFDIQKKPEYLNKEITVLSFITDGSGARFYWPVGTPAHKDNVKMYHIMSPYYKLDPAYNTAKKMPTVDGTEYKDAQGDYLFRDGVPYHSYYGVSTFAVEKGSKLVSTRLHRAANNMTIKVKNPKVKLGLPDDFDIKKLNLFQDKTSQGLNAYDDGSHTMIRYMCVDSRYMKYDAAEDVLTISYDFYHTRTTPMHMYIYYDGEPKKILGTPYGGEKLFTKEMNGVITIGVPNAYNHKVQDNISYQVIYEEKGYSNYFAFSLSDWTESTLPKLN